MILLIGSNKTNLMIGGNVIDENFRKFAVKMQLNNICKILGGEVHHQTIIDSKGKASKRIIITYREKNDSSMDLQ